MQEATQIVSRKVSAFRSLRDARHYWILLISLLVLGALASFGLLVYNNPVPIDSPSFGPVVERRMFAIITMIIVAICQSLATVAFQSVTSNKIITPSLLGYEALYSTIQTGTIFFFGVTALINFSGIEAFVTQTSIMVLMSLLLYGWLLSGKYANLHLMLLVGVIMGTGLRALSAFMRRLLSPSEFDILQARMFGSVNNADVEYFPLAIPLVIVTAALLLMYAKKLNVLSLGKDCSTSLGLKHQRGIIFVLVLVSVLMSVSTALIGPLSFFGFLVATLTYQAAKTYDHRYVLPMAIAIGFLVMTGAYFLMYHVFNAQGVVSIIIEMVGGIVFLIVILKKGTL